MVHAIVWIVALISLHWVARSMGLAGWPYVLGGGFASVTLGHLGSATGIPWIQYALIWVCLVVAYGALFATAARRRRPKAP
jgi:hypothetical protein